MEPKNCTIMRMTPTNGITWPKHQRIKKSLFISDPFYPMRKHQWLHCTVPNGVLKAPIKKDDKLTFKHDPN